MRTPVVGQRVRTRSGRSCKVIGVSFEYSICFVCVIDLDTEEEIEFTSGYLSEDYRHNWLHEGF